MEGMPRPRYQYVQRQVTRHGSVVWYFRIGRGARTRLPGAYGSDEFVTAWRKLMAGDSIETSPVSKHTLQWMVEKYQASAEWKALKPSTQRMRANILKRVCETGGKLLVSQIDRKVIAAGRDRRGDTPFAAINFMKVMGYLFEWGIDAGLAKVNPVKEVKRPKAKTDGHTPWSEEDVIAFYKTHPAGSQARLALELILFTGLRRSDVYLVGPQHIRDGVLEFKATKNGEDLFVPVHPLLQATLDNIKTGHLAYIVTPKHGRPFRSAAAFGNWFADMCEEAGVSGRAHGVRKSLAQKLAESGGSNAELKALFGWSSDAMAALYTKKADKRRLAQAASEKLKENNLSPHLVDGEGESAIDATNSNA